MAIDSASIAEAFSEAATRYDDVAAVQRWAAQQLLARMSPVSGRYLDAGCGTGWLACELARRGARLLALDLAPGMLKAAQRRPGAEAVQWLQGDMRDLPVDSGQLDGVVSNFALQWLPDPLPFFREVRRVLRPGGRLFATTLLPGTLQEMAEAWAEADPGVVHVNRFVPHDDVLAALKTAGLSLRHQTACVRTCHFASAAEAARSIKDVGAHNMNLGRRSSLTGIRRFRRFLEAWEAYRTPEGVPQSWHVLFLEAQA